ncbi:iron chelate uptake ABC transporter family permease subunit [Streptomyces anulatus]
MATRAELQGIRLVLIGLGRTAMLGSVNFYPFTRASLNGARNAHIWLVGTFDGRGWSSVRIMTVAPVIFLPPVLRFGRRLWMTEVGDDLATGLGVRMNRWRNARTLLATGLCGIRWVNRGMDG